MCKEFEELQDELLCEEDIEMPSKSSRLRTVKANAKHQRRNESRNKFYRDCKAVTRGVSRTKIRHEDKLTLNNLFYDADEDSYVVPDKVTLARRTYDKMPKANIESVTQRAIMEAVLDNILAML